MVLLVPLTVTPSLMSVATGKSNWQQRHSTISMQELQGSLQVGKLISMKRTPVQPVQIENDVHWSTQSPHCADPLIVSMSLSRTTHKQALVIHSPTDY